MGPTLFTELGPKKNQKADFAMKQTNICRLSGDITSPARLAQLLQPALAFCFSLQPMTAYRPILDGTPSLAAS